MKAYFIIGCVLVVLAAAVWVVVEIVTRQRDGSKPLRPLVHCLLGAGLVFLVVWGIMRTTLATSFPPSGEEWKCGETVVQRKNAVAIIHGPTGFSIYYADGEVEYLDPPGFVIRMSENGETSIADKYELYYAPDFFGEQDIDAEPVRGESPVELILELHYGRDVWTGHSTITVYPVGDAEINWDLISYLPM